MTKDTHETTDLSLGFTNGRLVTACGEHEHIEIPPGNYTISELETIIRISKKFFTAMGPSRPKGPKSERTDEAGTWFMELDDGRIIPFHQGISSRNPLYTLQFDKGSHWEIEADDCFNLSPSLGEDGESNGKSIVPKRSVKNIYFKRFDETIEVGAA